MTKRALITGVGGQDGAYLAKLLLAKGYEVYGTLRRSSGDSLWRLRELAIDHEVQFVDADLLETSNLLRLLKKVKPDEVYNLAAQSFVGVSFEQPVYTGDVTGLGVARLLEACREEVPSARFYQASTSELFGLVAETPQRETTPFHPRSPYGVAKLYAHWMTINYRESYGMHACCGILFNHESPLRSTDFVTRRITHGLAQVRNGSLAELKLGNIDSRRDWGFAGDYVDGMWRMLQTASPADFVLATGVTTTVRDFVTIAGRVAGFELEWFGSGDSEFAIDQRSGRRVVSVDPSRYRPAEVDLLLGDSSKARSELEWEPKVAVDQLAEMMVTADLLRTRA